MNAKRLHLAGATFALALLLAGCQAAPTPTSTSVSVALPISVPTPEPIAAWAARHTGVQSVRADVERNTKE